MPTSQIQPPDSTDKHTSLLELSQGAFVLMTATIMLLLGCGVGGPFNNGAAGSGSSSSSAGLSQTLIFSKPTVDFGSATVGQASSSQVVQLTNASSKSANLSALTIDNAVFSLSSGTCESLLASGATCSLNLVFNPLTVGLQSAKAQMTSGGTSFIFQLTGNGAPNGLTLDPSAASFPDTRIGHSSSPLTFTLRNSAGVARTIEHPSVGSGFSVQSTTCSASLPPASTCTLTIAFTPISKGSIETDLSVRAGSFPTLAHLSGTGLNHVLSLQAGSGGISSPVSVRAGGAPLQILAMLDDQPTTAVRWDLKRPALGTIAMGVYTPPTTVASTAADIIVATLLSDTSIQANLSVLNYSPLPILTTATPSSAVSGATTALRLSGTGFTAVQSVTANGSPITFSVSSASQMTVTLSLRPSDVGPQMIVAHVGGSMPGDSNTLSIPVSPPAVSFDAAVRFSQQAGFGPTSDQIAQIQKRGFSGWIDWQLGNDPYDYVKDAGMDYGVYMANTQASSYALRQRLSLALREIYTFGYSPACYAAECGHYWEATIERDAFGNIRKLMNDVALSPLMGTFLNNAINFDGWPYTFTANQNFAREFLQLMTIGPNTLSPDGTLVLGSDGLPINSYTEDNIINMAAALSGWTFSNTDGSLTYYLADPMKPMQAQVGAHNMKQKTVLPGVTLPAGRTAPDDLSAVLDALYKHPNMGPFLSKQLIQHLVTSNPSPAYVRRVSTVFDNNGQGIKGDLSAVVRAILLDPEARRGDDPSSGQTQDAHVMEPILYMAHIMNLIGGVYTDDRVYVSMNPWGEEVLMEPTVFGYFSPTNALPDGTLSPEAQLLNNNAAMAKVGFLNSILHGSLPGLASDLHGSPLWNVSSAADLIIQMNHWMFHGTMPPSTQAALAQYASDHASEDVHSLLPNMLLIGLASSSFQVVH